MEPLGTLPAIEPDPASFLNHNGGEKWADSLRRIAQGRRLTSASTVRDLQRAECLREYSGPEQTGDGYVALGLGVTVASAPGASQGEGEAGATQADKSSAQTVSRIS